MLSFGYKQNIDFYFSDLKFKLDDCICSDGMVIAFNSKTYIQGNYVTMSLRNEMYVQAVIYVYSYVYICIYMHAHMMCDVTHKQ